MKLNKLIDEVQLNEEAVDYEVRKIRVSDAAGLQEFSDFYNNSGELTWKLTPQRLKKKIGSKGKLWGLYVKETGEMVGSIGLKHVNDGATVDIGEMGYAMLHPDHRSLPNLMTIFKQAIRKARAFDAVYVTTNTKNRTINKLLDRTPKLEKILKIKSQFSNNLLYVHYVKNTGNEQNEEIIRAYFKEHTLQEF
jgi:predicted acetyltransferase